MFAYVLLRNKILLSPKWRQTRPILHYSSVVNMGKGKFTNFKTSLKINENSYNDFFGVVIRRKRKFILAKNILGVSGTLNNFYGYYNGFTLNAYFILNFHSWVVCYILKCFDKIQLQFQEHKFKNASASMVICMQVFTKNCLKLRRLVH